MTSLWDNLTTIYEHILYVCVCQRDIINLVSMATPMQICQAHPPGRENSKTQLSAVFTFGLMQNMS